MQMFFRFLKLNKLQAITLGREIEGASYTVVEDTQDYVGSVPLLEDKFDDINLFFIRQKISMQDCDLLINSSSLAGSKEQSVPIKVNRFLKDIDCRLTLTCEE
ncbi:hypothetical protein L0668_10175 [Paraglaciecola aquimarina]|uniref:Uncharacterized protein n=1 Tax=Paraglaciecola algarum TaxID=3050085 RepID=A0ABS9D905_9ALTE|nr:hypothetical protein [Paraglaciecola sp. G1-23]MCF2948472.1 hypothetical protein [Paraglaciecola sp. G1-23]